MATFFTFILFIGLIAGIVGLFTKIPSLKITKRSDGAYIAGLSYFFLLFFVSNDARVALISLAIIPTIIVLPVLLVWLASATRVEVLAGDFKAGLTSIYTVPFRGRKYITLKSPNGGGSKMLKRWKTEKISLSELGAVDEVTKDNEKKFVGSLKAGLVGGAIFGGAGLLAGALSGGSKTKVAFSATFNDGRKFLGVVDGKHFLVLKAAAFK